MNEQDWVTTVITERVWPDKTAAFERWIQRAHEQLASAEGFRGVDQVRLDEGDAVRYITVVRFTDQDSLEAWEGSSDRQALVDDLEPFHADTVIDRAEGIEMWFSMPPRNRSRNPVYWRQVAVSAPVVFLLILLVSWVLRPLIGEWPFNARLFVEVVGVSMLLTWPVMPFVTKALRRFLYP